MFKEKIWFRDILYNDDQLGPYPTQLLKHVNNPTNKIIGPIERRDPRKKFSKSKLKIDVRKYPFGAALIDFQEHIITIKKNRNKIARNKAPIPNDPRVLSRHFKSLGYFLGADIMGIGKLPQSSVYSHDLEGKPINASYKYAIVFVVRKPDKSICASNGWDYIIDPASFQAYIQTTIQSECLANYIRRLGYDAEASYYHYYLNLMPPVLLEAGIGEVCRMGIILNPFIGTNYKASCVLTNLEIECDRPIDFGLQKYCQNCGICAEQCPAGAIPHGNQILYNGYYTWKLNREACRQFGIFNKEGSICGRCTKICPWHRPNTEPHDFINWDGNIEELYRGVNEQRKRLIKNNYVDLTEPTNKWWFDLEEVNSDLIIPTAKNKQKICRQHHLNLQNWREHPKD